uniref:Uncharacterized protein n=1 Tax=Solanum tuberosum TaxID=4113 RepID=M1DDX4_SOLTU
MGGFNESEVDDELRSFREEKSKRKRRKRGERAPLPDHVKLGTEEKKGLDAGYDESTCGNRNNLEGKLGGDEPYYPSDEAASFETDPDAFSDDEEEVQQRERIKPRRRKKGSVACRTRMVGMGILHTQSGATIINPGMPSERFRNVKSSAVVTGDLGHKPPCGVKWRENKL